MGEKLEQCEQDNTEAFHLKDQMVAFRGQKQQALALVSQQNEEYQARFTDVNERKHALRVHLSDVERKLRQVQRDIAASNVENATLKALLSGEKELRDERQAEERQALELVDEDLKLQCALSLEDQHRVAK